MALVPIIKFAPGDCIKLKKPHPCGGSLFRILRVGSEVRIVCTTCSRDMTVDRIKLEKATKQHLPAEQSTNGKGTDANT